ncbi:MAG TPA: hypothetical protein VGE36_18595, partial [Roseateles sp.]
CGEHEQSLRRGGALSAADLAGVQALLDDSLAALRERAPATAPVATAVSVNPLETLQQLRQLLAERNMRSLPLSEQLAGHAEMLGPGHAALAAAIARLDFAAALAACDALIATLSSR